MTLSWGWSILSIFSHFHCYGIYSLQLPFRVTCTEFNYVFIVIYLSSTLQFVALCLFAHTHTHICVRWCVCVCVCECEREIESSLELHKICVLIFTHCSTPFHSQNKLIIMFIVIASHQNCALTFDAFLTFASVSRVWLQYEYRVCVSVCKYE